MRIVVVALVLVLALAGAGCAVELSLAPDHVVDWKGTAADSLGADYPEDVTVTYTVERQFHGGEYEDFMVGVVHDGAGIDHALNLVAENHTKVRYRIKTVLDVGGVVVEQQVAERCETDWFWWLGLFGDSCGVRKAN